MTELSFFLADEQATLDAGKALATAMCVPSPRSVVIYLQGQLGAGKTTLSRGVLQALGHQGAVKSPTYTLVEPYELAADDSNLKKIYHFDLYRLRDPQELELLGVQEYFDDGCLCLVEWPERGQGFLPEADVVVELGAQAAGRQLVLRSATATGEAILKKYFLSIK